MGTSSIYSGPNRSPLLPPDFNHGGGPPSENNPDKDRPDGRDEPPIKNPPGKSPNNEPSPDASPPKTSRNTPWSAAKTAMSKYASGHGGRNGKRNAVSKYIKGYGGSSNAAKSAKVAIRTTIQIGDFFGGVKKKGIASVLNDFQIPIEGRRPKEILNDIVNLLAPTPDSGDDTVARKALVTTMSVIYEMFDDEKKDLSLLDSINPDISMVLIAKYIESFIYERLIHDVGSRIEKNAKNSETASKIEKELKEYIEAKVSTTLKDKPFSIINSQTTNVTVLVEGLYQQCYKVLEDQL